MLTNSYEKFIKCPVILSLIVLILSIIGLTFGYFITNPYSVVFPMSTFLSSIFFLLYIKFSGGNTRREYYPIFPNNDYVDILYTIYFLIFNFTIVVYYINGFVRTNTVHFLIIMGYVIIFTIILIKPSVVPILLVTILNSALDRFLAFFSSSLYTGVDIYLHSRWVHEIIQTGTLVGLQADRYYYAPFYHIFGSVSSLVIDLPVRSSIILAISGSTMIVFILFAYVLGSHFWGKRIGLIASVLYVGSDAIIHYGIHPVTTTYGMALFAIVFTISIIYITKPSQRLLLLITFIIVAILLTHQTSAFITTIFLSTVAVLYVSYNSKISWPAINLALLSIFAVISDFMITLRRGPAGPDRSFFDVAISRVVYELSTAGFSNRAETSFPSDIAAVPSGAAGMSNIHILGPGILLFLGVLGMFLWMNHDRSHTISGAWILGGVSGVTLFISLVSPAIGLHYILTYRWFGFIFLPLSILGAYSIVRLVSSLNFKYSVKSSLTIIIIILIVPYFLFMGGNLNATIDRPMFDNAPAAQTLSVNEYEMSLVEFTNEVSNSNTKYTTDRRLESILYEHYEINNLNTFTFNYQSGADIPNNSILINRSYAHTRHARYNLNYENRTIPVLGPIPVNTYDSNILSKIYTNGPDSLEKSRER